MNSENRKMYMSIHELAQLAGISVRTLHYYDQIGLLVPSKVGDNGYRYYDDENLESLQEIMLFRELEFPLKGIKVIMSDPEFDKGKALENQIKLLESRRDHIEDLIRHARRIKSQEEWKMDFKVFDNSKIEGYQKLAEENWGDTEAYREYKEKSSRQTDTEKRQAAEDLMDIFYEFGDMKELDPRDDQVQTQVRKLQDFISEKYYTCTNQILAGLGQMYSAGGEMTQNIDVAGGKGCAEFVTKAIEEYCRKKLLLCQ